MALYSIPWSQSLQIASGYRYREKGYKGGGVGGNVLVVLSCCPEASSASAAKTMALENIIILDPTSREKASSGVGSRRRRTTKNMMTGVQYSLQLLGRSLCIFGDGGIIGMVTGSDYWEGSKVKTEAEALILKI